MRLRVVLLLCCAMPLCVFGNDVRITQALLTDHDAINGHIKVRFNITWQNGWRTSSDPSNWDAAWVFVKYRDAGDGLWKHARLHSNAGHVAPMGSTISTGLLDPSQPFNAASNPGMGAFIHRSANGTGTFTANGVELRWNLAQNGITLGDVAEARVFAIEMVLVPEGSFQVGSGGVESNRFKNGPTNDPFPITSENAIQMGNVDGQLWAQNGTYIEATTLPASFPKGFRSFYCMKYDISQQQYVNFLNTLTRTQQNARTGTDLAPGITSVSERYVMSGTSVLEGRNGIRCDATIDASAPVTFYCDLNGNGISGEADDGQWNAANFVMWSDLAAYLDWSALRPMTELEFEKACRGPLAPIPNEYAWGSTTIAEVTSITNPGTMNEASTTPGANAVFNFVNNPSAQAPLRTGLTATSTSGRVAAGATYYGILGMSGNLWERPISLSSAGGRAFTGQHGDGILAANGAHDTPLWPGADAVGVGYRGGGWFYGQASLRISDRVAVGVPYNDRTMAECGRGVRFAP